MTECWSPAPPSTGGILTKSKLSAGASVTAQLTSQDPIGWTAALPWKKSWAPALSSMAAALLLTQPLSANALTCSIALTHAGLSKERFPAIVAS